MSVVIKNMQMPTSCEECRLSTWIHKTAIADEKLCTINVRVCAYREEYKEYKQIDDSSKHPDWCPLEEIKEPTWDGDKNMKKLWRFEWDSYYGNLTGLFKATDEEIINLIGKEVYFGEMEGKHSEVCGTIEEGEITLESDNPVVVEAIEPIGLNPLECITEE